MGAGLTLLAPVGWRLVEESEAGLLLGAWPIVFFALALVARGEENDMRDHVLEVDNEYERAKLADSVDSAADGDAKGRIDERAALKLFQVHSSDLRRYYDEALEQARCFSGSA